MSEFRAVQDGLRKSGIDSWYDKIVAELDDARRADLDAALADMSITPKAIEIVLAKWGYKVSRGQIGHHRRDRVRPV